MVVLKKIFAMPLALLLLLGIIWGTGYSIARFAMTSGVPPLGYSFWQSLGPAILISTLVFSRQRFQKKISLSHTYYYLICGLTGIVIPNTNMYFASPHLPAGLLAVIVNTVPVMAYPLALLAKRESFHWMRCLGIILTVTGIMLIIIPKASLPSPTMIPWVFSALITPLSFAFCSVFISRYRPQHTDSLSLSSGTLIASSILLLPLVLFHKDFYMLHLPPTLADSVIILEIILSSIGYILFFQLIKIAGPVYYSLVDSIVAMTGLFWGFVIFHERLNEWTSLAVFLIILSLLLVNKYQKSMVNSQAVA